MDTAVCLDGGGVCILEASGIFPVGVTMHTCAVEHHKAACCQAATQSIDSHVNTEFLTCCSLGSAKTLQ